MAILDITTGAGDFLNVILFTYLSFIIGFNDEVYTSPRGFAVTALGAGAAGEVADFSFTYFNGIGGASFLNAASGFLAGG